MTKNNKINVRKIWNKWSMVAALVSLSIVPFIAIGVSDNQFSQYNNATNLHNDDSKVDKTRNINHKIWDSQSSDFLLNANNAITLNQNVNYKSSTSIVNGPEGFLANYNNKLSYIGYDGVEKWNSPSIEFNNSDKFLISSYYNSYSNSFIILYSKSNTTIFVATISAENGQVLATSTAINTTNITRYLLVPVNNSAGNNEIDTYAIISKSSISANSRTLTSIVINQQGLINLQTTINFIDTPGSGQANYMILSSGAIEFNNNSYFFFLSSFQNGPVWLRVFVENNNELNFLSQTRVLKEWNNHYVDTVLDINIPEIWVSAKGNQIEIAAFLNAIVDNSDPWVFGATADLTSTSANLKINSINLGELNISFNIKNARFYGDYLYGYLTQGNQNNIIRLKVSDQQNGTWNTEGLNWDHNDVDYTNNDRIILYDTSYANANANIIAQPIFQDLASGYSGNNQLFVMDAKATNLWLLSGNKPAFAYNTWAKKDINNISISGVSDIFVADANANLNTYFTNATLQEYFSQYQTGTTYTIDKKTSPDAVIEHAKGNIPATLVIEKGYDSNNKFVPLSKTFDIVLTGFKNFETSFDTNPTPDISLNDTLAQSIKSNQPINEELKTYLIENVILPKNTLTKSDLASIEVESYNNLTGTLVLKSVTLNRYYAAGGILEDTPFTFIQEITINGFKEVFATAIVANNTFTFNELNAILASDISDEQLQQLIFNKRNEIFETNSLPDDFVLNNIIAPFNKTHINDTAGTLNVSFDLNNYYDNDGIGTLKTFPNKSFGPITIAGFNQLTFKTSINLNPTKTNDLEAILAQTVDLSNEIFKQYLFNHVIIDPSKNITIDNITSIKIKPDSFNNRNGTLILDSITLNKWYDDKSILQNNEKEFVGEINLQGFKIITPTVIVANNTFTFAELNTILASGISDEQLQQLIFNKRNEIFETNSLPDNFVLNNIIAPFNKTDINDTAGTLSVSFDLNNYYDNDVKGTLKISPNKSFGPITIAGFNQLTFKTSINSNPTMTNDLEAILAQTTVDLSNEIFKQYLFKHVIIDPSKNITIDNITSIKIKPDSFNNRNGTLILDSITLNKWYDDKSILQNNEKEFVGEINLQGFKIITPTALKKNPDPNKLLDIDGGYRAVKASQVSDEQIWQIILNKLDDIFVADSFPDNIKSSIINGIQPTKNNANDDLGTIEIKFDLLSFYEDDSQGTWIDYKPVMPDSNIFIQKEFGPLIISGFTDLSTSLVQPTELINSNEYPYEMTDLNHNDIMKKFIFDNVIKTKNGLNFEDVDLINLNSYDNKEGIIKIDSIQLKRWVTADGVTISEKPKIFDLRDVSNNLIPIEIKGFKKVVGPTMENPNSVSVSDGLETIKIKDLGKSDNPNLLDAWIQGKKDVLILNLPNKPNPSTISIEGYDETKSDITMGVLAIKLNASSYYEVNDLYTYQPLSKTFTVILDGFKKDFETSINTSPQKPLPEDFREILAQKISEKSVVSNIDIEFKNYLLNEVVAGKKENLVINGYKGDYNNLEGTFILQEITLNQSYDENGILVPGPFSRSDLNIFIKGFKAIAATAIVANNTFTFKELNTILASGISDEQIKQLIFAKRNEIFETNSLPDDFVLNNIIAPFNKTHINDTAGTLNVSFDLNNYYDNDVKGTLKISPNKSSFGPITIAGFNQLTFKTSINLNPTKTNDLAAILAQTTVDLSNKIFKQYLFNYVIIDPSKNITIDNITSIKIKPDSFNNINGTLFLDSITLNKWYDDKSILQNSEKEFVGEINLQGFKIITPTAIAIVANNTFTFAELSNKWWEDFKKEPDYGTQIEQLIFNKRNDIFVLDSLPESFTIDNIKMIELDNIKPIDDTKDTKISLKFDLNNYYDDDVKGTLITSHDKSFGPITIAGFKPSEKTIVKPDGKIDAVDELSQEFLEKNDSLEVIKEFITNKLIEGPKDTTIPSAAIEILKNDIEWNNYTGELTIKKITLNKHYDYKGNLIKDKPQTYENITISGFEKIDEPTRVKDGYTLITGDLSKSEVSAITNLKLQEWLNLNSKDIFISFPKNANITIIDMKPSPVDGQIRVSIELNQYYEGGTKNTLVKDDPIKGPLKLTFYITGFLRSEPFPIIPVSLGAGAAVVLIIIAIVSIVYFYKKKKYKTMHVTSEKDL